MFVTLDFRKINNFYGERGKESERKFQKSYLSNGSAELSHVQDLHLCGKKEN